MKALGKFSLLAIAALISQGCVILAAKAAKHGVHPITVHISHDSSDHNGNTTKESRTVSAFTKIRVSSGLHLEFEKGDKQLVTVSAEKNILPHIVTEVKDGMLDCHVTGNFTAHEPMTIKVVAPHLESFEGFSGSNSTLSDISEDQLSVHLSGGSEATLTGQVRKQLDVSTEAGAKLEADFGKTLIASLAVHASGGAHAELEVHAQKVKVSGDAAAEINLDLEECLTAEFALEGGSRCEASGKAKDITVKASSGANLDLDSLDAENVDYTGEGGAQCHVNADKSLKVNVTSGADFDNSGSAKPTYINH